MENTDNQNNTYHIAQTKLFRLSFQGASLNNETMKRIMKRLPCFLAILYLLTAFMPQTALAAGTGKSIQLISADNPSGGIADGDHIYMALGAGVPDKTRRRAQHNPEIVFNEKILPAGVAAYAKIAADYLTGRSRKN